MFRTSTPAPKSPLRVSNPPPFRRSASTPNPRDPVKYAMFCGYEMSPPDFKDFVNSLPSASLELSPSQSQTGSVAGLKRFIFTYDRWRRQQTNQAIPVLRQRFVSEEASRMFSLDTEPLTSGLFFPLRFVEFQGDQLDEFELMETMGDKTLLDSFVHYVKSCDGSLDTSKVEFRFMKDLHPSVEWRTF